ncbi:unnamed protein product [Diamesa serratosioi]
MGVCKVFGLLLFSFLIFRKFPEQFSAYSERTVVKIEPGDIVGDKRGNFYAYEAIPYAEPVVGDNRYELPKQYAQTWTGKKEFKKVGPICLQWNHFPDNVLLGDEDCLTLNVYVPEAVVNALEPAPVVFYIHGGAFMFGGALYYGPENLMDAQNVILVTVNYRLGILGFLSTEDEVLPGNLGLKDQVEALKWVQKNIRAFNGDPDKVTISGYSAGGASVQLFYMSELTNGLFQNGISHSGVALNPWVMCENSREKAYKVASLVDCPTDSHEEMVKCLKGKPAGELVKQAEHFQPFLYNPFSPFGVVVEQASPTAFLTDYPENILKNKKSKNLPWLATICQDEGLYPAAQLYNDDYLETLDKGWNEHAKALLDFNGTTTDETLKVDISIKIRDYYLQQEVISKDSYFKLRDIVSDRLYNYGAIKAINLQSQISPTFFYHFQYKSLFGLGEMLSEQKAVNLGVAHGEDVLLIFKVGERKKLPYSAEELLMIGSLTELYFNFADKNVAVYQETALKEITTGQFNTMEIYATDKFENIFKDDFANSEFWDDLGIKDFNGDVINVKTEL